MASKCLTSTASPVAVKRPKSAIRHQTQVTFQSEASKLEFLSRLDGAKQRLFPTGGSVDNYHLLTNLLDLLDGGSSVLFSRRSLLVPVLWCSPCWIHQISFT